MKDENKLLVSVCCLTYNHASYIRQCLDGCLMQKTNFSIEILIHDDASTDGTQDIIREYEARYPEIIKPIYQKENQYSKGVKVDLIYNFSRAKGKYIALCEGDDYWTDPLKLQKQVDFLETHPDYVMCSHFWMELYQESGNMTACVRVESKTYRLYNLIDEEWLFQPLTVVFRTSALDLSYLGKFQVLRDTVLFYALLKKGWGFYLPDVMGVYRLHQAGVWTGKSNVEHWLSDFNVRKGIYEQERTDDAVLFLQRLVEGRLIGRVLLLQRYKELIYIYRVISRHKGIFYAVRMIVHRLCWPHK